MSTGDPPRFLTRVRAHLARRHELYWVPALYMVVLVYIYHDIFFRGHGPRMGLGWDTIEAYWPDLSYLGHSLRHGQWPLWNPFERGGFPDIGVPERGTFYPLNWILAGGADVIFGHVTWWVGQLRGLGHQLIAALAMHLFLRRRRLPAAAAAAGGLAWLSSSPQLLHKASSVIWPLAWLPLVWLAIDAAIERPTPRRALLLGGAIALAGNAGSWHGFFLLIVSAGLYAAFRATSALACAPRDGRTRLWLSGRLALVAAIAGAVTLAALLVTVLPSLDLTAASQRAHRTLGYALSFPVPAGPALSGLFATGAGPCDLFGTAAGVLLAMIAVTAGPLRDRGAPLFFAASAVLFVALATGGSTPVLPWLVEHVPGFGLFRAANRYKLIFAPSMAVLVGYGTAVVLERARGLEPRALIIAGTCALLLGLVVAMLAIHAPARGKAPAHWLPLVTTMMATLLVGAALVAPRPWMALVPIAIAAAMIVWEPQHHVHFRAPALEKRVNDQEDRRWLDGLADVTRDWRIFDEFVLEQRAGSRLGVREFRSYPAGASLEPRRYGAVMRYAGKHPSILEAFNIRYYFQGPHHRAGRRANRLKRPLDRMNPAEFHRIVVPECKRRHLHNCPVFEAAHPAPAVAWYGAARVERGGANKLFEQLRQQITSGGLRVVALEPDAAATIGPQLTRVLEQNAAEPPASVPGKVQSLRDNSMRVEVTAPGPGIVVINDTMYPGWQATVDGRDADLFRANYYVRGVIVGPGHHVIEMRFRPRHHRALLLLYTLAFFAVLGAAVWPRRPRATT